MKKQVAKKEAPDSPEDAGMLAEQQPAQEVKPKAKPRAKKVVAAPEPEPVSAESSAEVEPATPVKAKAAKKAAAKKAVSKKAVSAKTSPVEPAETAPETSADQDAEAPVVEAAPVSESAAPKTELAPKKSQAKKSKGRDLVAEVPAEAEVAEVLHEQPEAAAAESEIVPELEVDETEEDEEPVQAPAREEHLERLQ